MPAVLLSKQPGVAELADAADSKSAGALLRVASTPSSEATHYRKRFIYAETRINKRDLKYAAVQGGATKFSKNRVLGPAY